MVEVPSVVTRWQKHIPPLQVGLILSEDMGASHYLLHFSKGAPHFVLISNRHM